MDSPALGDLYVIDNFTELFAKRIESANPSQKTYHVNYIPKQITLHRLG